MKYGGRSLANIEEGKVTEEKDRNMPSESEEMPHKVFEYFWLCKVYHLYFAAFNFLYQLKNVSQQLFIFLNKSN